MTARDRLRLSYELAFFPPCLNRIWREISEAPQQADPDLRTALDDAWRLHLALPKRGYASQRALERLAVYQARARAYGIPTFIQAVRKRMGCPVLDDREVPPHLVRDIGLPEFCRKPVANPQPTSNQQPTINYQPSP